MRSRKFPPSAVLVALLVLAALTLASCGFKLRGSQTLPFDTLYVAGGNEAFVADLKRVIAASSSTRLVDDAKSAQAVLQIDSVHQEKHIVSLSGAGRVREFQLRYRVSFRLNDDKNRLLIPASVIALNRDMTYDDTLLLAKEAEEALLYRDMQNDAIQQILRRLSAARAG